MLNFLILIVVSLSPIFSQNGWYLRDSVDGTFHGVKVVNEQVSFLLNSKTDVTLLYKSTNFGNSWDKISEIPYQGVKYGGHCFDVIGEKHIFIGTTEASIFISNDSGKTYKQKIIVENSNSIFRWINMKDDKIGIVTGDFNNTYITFDGWETFKKVNIFENNDIYRNIFRDSTIYTNFGFRNEEGLYLYRNMIFNFYTNEYQLLDFTHRVDNLIQVNDTLMFMCGSTGNLQGGTGQDAIWKSTDAGITWVRKLNFYSSTKNIGVPRYSPFGIKNLTFKDDKVGVAIGYGGKTLYTYDGGESWFYELKRHNLLGAEWSTMNVEIFNMGNKFFAIAGYGVKGTFILELTEDNLKPREIDTITVDGFVYDYSKNFEPFEGALIALAPNKSERRFRLTVSDKNGYFKFKYVPFGDHNLDYIYYMYNEYIPYYTDSFGAIRHFKNDTTIKIVLIDIRTYSNISGSVVDNLGNSLNEVKVLITRTNQNLPNNYRDTVKTNEDGFYLFENVENLQYDIRPLENSRNYQPEYHRFTLSADTVNLNFVNTALSVTQNHNFQLRDNVLISEEVAGMNYRIISLSGRVVKSAHLPKELNLNAHPTGTYILHIS